VQMPLVQLGSRDKEVYWSRIVEGQRNRCPVVIPGQDRQCSRLR